ncbi:MAG: hypothetical protein QNJ26_01855 [Desulfobacterales bacterium]|nr:hypothetical protein [Desulfobacterales bacterium]
MLDIAVAYNRFKFLGEEFLTWLWFVVDQDTAILRKADPEFASLEIGNRMVLEKRHKKSVEKITIKGENAGLEEAMLALQKGALVTELNLVYRSAELKWQFTLKGESLNLSSLKTPKIAAPDSPEDMEGFILEKIFLYDKILQFLEKLYKNFIKERVSSRWQKGSLILIKKWSQSGS